MFMVVKRDMFDPKKGCSFKTFFIRILRQHFGGIVSQSYRRNEITRGIEITPATHAQYSAAKFSHSAFDIVAMRYILQDFTPDELEYVKMVLSFIGSPVKFRRKLTREALNISCERERELRGSIHDKILK